jgi:putative membrane protein
MNEHSRHRRPAAFRIGDARVTVTPAQETSALAGPAIRPASEQLPLPLPVSDRAAPPRGKARWGTLFWCAAGGLLLLAIALGLADLVQSLFARNAALGRLRSS